MPLADRPAAPADRIMKLSYETTWRSNQAARRAGRPASRDDQTSGPGDKSFWREAQTSALSRRPATRGDWTSRPAGPPGLRKCLTMLRAGLAAQPAASAMRRADLALWLTRHQRGPTWSGSPGWRWMGSVALDGVASIGRVAQKEYGEADFSLLGKSEVQEGAKVRSQEGQE